MKIKKIRNANRQSVPRREVASVNDSAVYGVFDGEQMVGTMNATCGKFWNLCAPDGKVVSTAYGFEKAKLKAAVVFAAQEA